MHRKCIIIRIDWGRLTAASQAMHRGVYRLEPALVQRIEELSLNALPALQTLFCDGWVLRFANGYTKRANSINPLYGGNWGLDERIAACERQYTDRGMDVVYKMTPCAPAELDGLLQRRGYVADSRTSVQRLDLTAPQEPKCAAMVAETLTEEWLSSFCAMNRVHTHARATLQLMLAKIMGKTGYISLVQAGNVLACGLGVLENQYVGLFDIVTDPAYRKQGLGTELVLNLLHWAKHNGAQAAYLQVVQSNAAALRLYARVGFREIYPYWYRIRRADGGGRA